MTEHASRLLAAGRDADIYEDGPGLVVRRSRQGRSLAYEAMVMDHVRRAGYPAPFVHELRAGDTELVMQRLEGPSMAELAFSRPWSIPSLARTLAGLHGRLGAIAAPAGLRRLPDGGATVVHLDLHPLNVVMTAQGPYVIDWTNAAAGRPETDVASTWVIVRSSEIPGGRLQAAVGRAGRQAFLRPFLRSTGLRHEAAAMLPSVIATRLADRNLTGAERRFLRRWSEALVG
ncbi:MAG TPA: phosphotransferase [Acidimicrobiales bacterium]|nr:phosphotransferase [Acidimicrobiales bacterium]